MKVSVRRGNVNLLVEKKVKRILLKLAYLEKYLGGKDMIQSSQSEGMEQVIKLQKNHSLEKMIYRKQGIYELYIKRLLDIFCSLAAIIVFGWLYIIVAIMVRVRLGSPVLFKQPRPGKDEKIFEMYKFRSMSNATDKDGNLLPDTQRLGTFGKWLRSTSLDELPEALNILKGDMSVVGPRPQLVKDMVFMTTEQRMRHTARPGLSGLAQVNGRNEIGWEDKLDYDIKYIKNISFFGDIRIIVQTIGKVFVKKEGITSGDMATAEDFGDYLLHSGKVSQDEYIRKQKEAQNILLEKDKR